MLIRLTLDTLVEHWGSAAVRLGPEELRRVRELVRLFAAAGTAGQRQRAACRLAEYACSVVPPDHPVAVAGTGIDPAGRHPAEHFAAEASDWTALAAALARRAGETDPDARTRLLAAPALTAEQLRLRGGDPELRGLIRLDFSEAADRDGGRGDDGFCDDCAGRRAAGCAGGASGDGGGAGGTGAADEAERAVSLPVFQFDPAGRLLPEVQAVNEMLDAGADPWGVADWWLGPNAWLDAVPADLVGRGAGRLLLEAARAVAGED
jgi:hypothetical protein